MKRIIFAEGKNDIRLLKEIVDHGRASYQVDDFIGEEIVSNVGGEESRAIRSFVQRRNPYHIFLKSEGGKPELKRLFSRMMPQLYDQEVTYPLLIDLDGGSFEGIKDDLNQRCSRITADLQLEIEQRTISNAHLTGYDCSVNLNGECRDCFPVLCFEHSMETAAGIDKGQDSLETQTEKILRLSREDLVSGPVRDLFFPS